jgi:hypothetical protein
LTAINFKNRDISIFINLISWGVSRTLHLNDKIVFNHPLLYNIKTCLRTLCRLAT